MKITAENEINLVTKILSSLGVNKEDCKIVSQATLDSDLKGFTSHGIGRFPQYIKGIKCNNIALEGQITIEKETPAMALINGNNLFGQAVAYKAMKLAIKKAKDVGIGVVGTHNGNHFGVTGYYSDLAIREGCIGIVIANTAPAIAPIGGKDPLIGTNPIAIGIPSDSYIAVDMATSASARGKLLEAQRKGHDIPVNTALDSDGNMTTDPTEALKGSILPFGGLKGYALSLMIEILCGPLVSAGYGTGVTGTVDHTENCTKGDLFLAIDPSKFVDEKLFRTQTEEFVKEIRDMEGDTFIPGDLEVRKIAEAEANGISIDPKLYEQLKEICEGLDININDYIEE